MHIHFCTHIHTHTLITKFELSQTLVCITLHTFRIKSELLSIAHKGLGDPAPVHFSNSASALSSRSTEISQLVVLRPSHETAPWLIPPHQSGLSTVSFPVGGLLWSLSSCPHHRALQLLISSLSHRAAPDTLGTGRRVHAGLRVCHVPLCPSVLPRAWHTAGIR